MTAGSLAGTSPLRSASEEVPAAGDGATGHGQQDHDRAEYHQHGADDPQDREVQSDTGDHEQDAQDGHRTPFPGHFGPHSARLDHGVEPKAMARVPRNGSRTAMALSP